MGLIFKLIFFTLVFAFIVYVFKMIARISQRLRATITDVNKIREVIQTAQGQPPKVSADMVRCANCGSFVATREAVTLSVKQQREHFCSRECVNVAAATK